MAVHAARAVTDSKEAQYLLPAKKRAAIRNWDPGKIRNCGSVYTSAAAAGQYELLRRMKRTQRILNIHRAI